MSVQTPSEADSPALDGLNSSEGPLSEMASLKIADPTIPKPGPPIANFPLPRELRDRIYGFLLEAGTTKKLHVSILRANKTIGAEATKYLYGENAFVLVDYNMPAFYVATSLVGLSNLQSMDTYPFKHQCLEVDIQWPQAPYTDSLEDEDPNKQTKKGIVLMLLEDMPKLWETLGFLCGQAFPDAALVSTCRDERLSLHRTKMRCKPAVKVEARHTAYRKSPEGDKACVLQGIDMALGAGYHLQVVDANGLVLETPAAIAPSIIWPRAFLESRTKVARKLKKLGDELAVAGQALPAALHFDNLLRLSTAMCLSDVGDVIKDSTQQGMIPEMRRVVQLRVDLECSATDAYLRCKSLKAESVIHGLMVHLDTLDITMQVDVRHMYLLLLLLKNASNPLCDGALAHIKSAVDVLESAPIQTDRLVHDLGIINGVLAACAGRVRSID